MVRRLKDDVRNVAGGFPERKVVQIDVDGLSADAPDLLLFSLLDEYRGLRERRLHSETRRKQAAAGLLITGLQQRLLSSMEAFARTLRVHRRTVQRQWEKSQQGGQAETANVVDFDLLRAGVGPDDDRAEFTEQDLQAEVEAQFEAASAATAGPMQDATARGLFDQEQKLLDRMTDIAESSRGEPDGRVKKLIAWIDKHMCPGMSKSGGKWNDVRILIFTEYDDTKRYLHEQLGAAIAGTQLADERIAIFHGPTPSDVREQIKQAFNGDPAKYPVRILIATDAAREGLNLQARCWNLFHFDVPWNPSRMEQRNGRVDRKLQPSPVVNCHYFFYQQRPEDRILQVLIKKTKTIRHELGSLAQVIDSKLDKLMEKGIRREQIDQMAQEIESTDLEAAHKQSVQDELEESRQRQDELRIQIAELQKGIDRSKKSIGFDQEHFQSAISCALQMLHAAPLQQTEGDATQFRFPALDQREGADPTWASTMDTLRAPKTPDQRLSSGGVSHPSAPSSLKTLAP